MSDTTRNAIPLLSLQKASEHCKQYIEREYAGITLLGEPNSLPRKGCEIARKSIDQKSLEDQKRAADQAANRPDTATDRDPPVIVATKDTDLIQQLTEDSKRRVFITGEGGLGKTEFTRLIAFQLAKRFLDRPDVAAVPIRIELGTLSTKRDYDTDEDLLTHCLARNEHQWVRPYIDVDRVIFCLDGLDELTVAPNDFYPSLANFIGQHDKCTFVLAGRLGSLPGSLMGRGLF